MGKGKCSSIISVYLQLIAGPNSNITCGIILSKTRKTYFWTAVAFLTSLFEISFWQVLLWGHCKPYHLRSFESLFPRDAEDSPLMCSFFDSGLENLNAVSKVCGRKVKAACHPERSHSYSSSQRLALNICEGSYCIFYHRFALWEQAMSL